MCEELKLRKLDSEAWGFRLTGGRDFGTPLTVLRVTGASVAEESGMEVGDMIVSINGTCTQAMTHVEAQQHILGAGSSLTLQILRGCPVPAPELTSTPLRGMTPNNLRCESEMTNESLEPLKLPKSPLHLLHNLSNEAEPTEEELTEQKIAEKMLENAELLEGNVIGVNFKRFIPKVDFIKNSLVYQVLQEEQVYKAKTEEEQLEKQPEKRFSTFMVHPNNAKPKIKKEAAKLAKRPKTPLEPEPEKPEAKKTDQSADETNHKTLPKPDEKEVKDEPQVETSEVSKTESNIEIQTTEQNLESIEISENKETEVKQIEIKSVEIVEESIEATQEKHNEQSSIDNYVAPLTKQEILNAQQELPAIAEVLEENEEVTDDSEFNKQLGLVKTQLASLRQLPSLIETQLNLFQTQIDCLVELKHKENKTVPDAIPRESEEAGDQSVVDSVPNISLEQASESECKIEADQQVVESHVTSDKIETSEPVDLSKDTHDESKDCHNEESVQNHGCEPIDGHGCEHETPIAPKPKSKKSSLFNGITPQPRPVVLPGGRIWRKPQDAYNEKFIADTICSQAEVLIGSTTGVNFRKYEPPKFSMSESAVWRLINNIENEPTEVNAADGFYKTPIDEKKIFVAGLHMNPDVEAVVREVEQTEALRNAPPVNNHHVEVRLGQEPVSSF